MNCVLLELGHGGKKAASPKVDGSVQTWASSWRIFLNLPFNLSESVRLPDPTWKCAPQQRGLIAESSASQSASADSRKPN